VPDSTRRPPSNEDAIGAVRQRQSMADHNRRLALHQAFRVACDKLES
jgi:hypothetical protein